ncbi:g7756 [Coccomyxa elongata]
MDQSGETAGTSRPDALLILASSLMCKGEVKESSKKLQVAQMELKTKMAKWSVQYHGTREYMICYAAAGHLLRFHAVRRGGDNIKAISPLFNLRLPRDRLKVMHMSISVLIIILQQTKHQFPSDRLPFGIMQTYKYSSIYYEGTYVEKTVDLSTYPFGDQATLEKVYGVLLSLPLGARGLIRPLREPVFKDGKWWKVKLPMGMVQPPHDLASLRCLVTDILHGLDALHQRGIVHRDVRHPNILKVSQNKYVLIDPEISAPAGDVPSFEPLSHWAPECKPNVPYQPGADIYSVGALISEEDLAFSSTRHPPSASA